MKVKAKWLHRHHNLKFGISTHTHFLSLLSTMRIIPEPIEHYTSVSHKFQALCAYLLQLSSANLKIYCKKCMHIHPAVCCTLSKVPMKPPTTYESLKTLSESHAGGSPTCYKRSFSLLAQFSLQAQDSGVCCRILKGLVLPVTPDCLECRKTFQHLDGKGFRIPGLWFNDYVQPSRRLKTGFQASLQHLVNNLFVASGWVWTPDQVLVVWCSIHWATVTTEDECEVLWGHRWTGGSKFCQ